MGNSIKLLLICAIAVVLGCNKDDEQVLDNILYYDADNQDAPVLAPGSYEAAARFPASMTSPYQGQQLLEVSFYIAALPDAADLKIYGPNSSNIPGDVLYSASVTNSLSANSWE